MTLVSVANATAELAAGADLLVVGAPTHMHGLPTASSRRAARKAAAKPESGLTLDPDAGGPALRDWLAGRPGRRAQPGRRLRYTDGRPRMFTGQAGRGISRLLRRHGYRLVTPPESFLVTKLNTLVDGESSRARQWGEALAAATAPAATAA